MTPPNAPQNCTCCWPTVFITRKCSQQIPQESDVSAPIPKTNRIIPDALSTTHQPQPAASQHFSFRVTVHQATLQAAILEGFFVLRQSLSCSHSNSKLFPAFNAMPRQQPMLFVSPFTTQCVHKLLSSGDSHHELLQRTRRNRDTSRITDNKKKMNTFSLNKLLKYNK